MTLPRFDKVIQGIGETRRRGAASQIRNPNHRRLKSYFDTDDFKIGSKHSFIPDSTPNKRNPLPGIHYEGSQMVDTVRVKQNFLKGDQEIVRY